MAEENAQSIAKSLKGILNRLDALDGDISSIASSTSETADAVSKPVKPSNEEKFEREKQNLKIVDAIKDMTAQLNERMKVLGDAFKDFQGGGVFSKLGTIIQIGFAVGAAYFYRAYKAIEPIINVAKAAFMGIKAAFDKLGITKLFQTGLANLVTKFKNLKAVKGIISFFGKITGPGGKILGFLKNILGVFKPVLSIFKPIIGIVSKLGKFLKAVPLLGQIITIIEGVYGAFKGFFSTEGSLVDKIFGAISGAVAQILQGLTFGLLDFDTTFEFLTGFFTTVREFFAEYVPPIWESLKESFINIWNGIYDFFAVVIPPIWEGMKMAFSMFLTGIGYYFDYVLMPTWEGVKWAMMKFWEGLQIAWEFLSPIASSVLDGMSWMFGKMYEFFVETVPGLFTKMLIGVISVVKSVIGKINGPLSYLGASIDTGFLDKLELGLKVVGPSALLGGVPNKAGSEVVAQTRSLNEGRSRMALGGAPSTNFAVAPVTNVQNNTFTKQPIRSSPTYDYDLGPKF